MSSGGARKRPGGRLAGQTDSAGAFCRLGRRGLRGRLRCADGEDGFFCGPFAEPALGAVVIGQLALDSELVVAVVVDGQQGRSLASGFCCQDSLRRRSDPGRTWSSVGPFTSEMRTGYDVALLVIMRLTT